jgi:hypothetical protein
MKTVRVPIERTTLEDVLKLAAADHAVFLTKRGHVCFALATADDMDQEAAALVSNHEFMAMLTRFRERGRAGPRKSLAEMEAEYGLNSGKRKPAKKRKTA